MYGGPNGVSISAPPQTIQFQFSTDERRSPCKSSGNYAMSSSIGLVRADLATANPLACLGKLTGRGGGCADFCAHSRAAVLRTKLTFKKSAIQPFNRYSRPSICHDCVESKRLTSARRSHLHRPVNSQPLLQNERHKPQASAKYGAAAV